MQLTDSYTRIGLLVQRSDDEEQRALPARNCDQARCRKCACDARPSKREPERTIQSFQEIACNHLRRESPNEQRSPLRTG